ncbi:MAG: C4-dicarboxylate ABC transporter [Ignavibacteriales bacterium CG07_land_8_20_14_0_80_59_12]|nr:MAG: C4-dicarboxylate ABC transporter [Ignavibacteriales bacterium CG07_land_8_20_14_0_80_59_12]
MTTLLIILILVIIALAGAPLFAIIAAIGLLVFTAAGTEPASLIAELYRLVNFPALIAIPLFTFAGYLLAESRAPKRLINLAQALVGWMPGGFAVVALFSTAIFTAFSGASGVTIIALGGLIFPALLKQNYPENFSLGLMTTSGSLGLLFPPSLPIILYSIVARDAAGNSVNIDKLFVAGLIPGILLLLILSAYSIRTGIVAKVPRNPFSFKAAWAGLKEAAWEAPLPVIVIGGIYGGIFTATEAAAVTAFYVLVVEVFIRRDLKFFSDLPRIIRESMILVGAILVMLGAAMGVTSYLIDAEIPNQLFGFVSQYVSSKFVFLVILNVFILVMNMIEIFSAIIIVVPIIVPVALQYGVDPIHLGIIFLLNLEIGYMTPPLGLNLFLSSLRFDRPLTQVYRTVLPFFLLLVSVLLLITYFPELSLALTGAVGVR